MKKITIVLFLFLLAVTTVSAVTADPTPIIKFQPDGTEVTVRLRGDEKVHWMETLDGYTLMYDTQRYIVYATVDAEGNMIPSAAPYMGESKAQRSPAAQQLVASLPKGIRYSASQVATLRQIWEIDDNLQQQAQAAPVTGEKKALCVLMGFQNKPITKTRAEFEALLNQVGYNVSGARGSVKDFYRENSYGKMDLTIAVAGPYTASNTTSYFANNTQAFAREAALAADADVNYADFAVDGRVETFHIIFAGYGDEAVGNGQQIWSHKWQLSSQLTLDGVRLSVYSCSPELQSSSGSRLTNIGVICHELCHVFGAPDYYDTNEESSGGYFLGTGDWDLMANGSWNDNGRTPAHINMFQKILYGWVEPTELSTPEQNIVDMPNSAENAIAYTISAHTDGEMYVLENRQQTGFDAYVPGHGLLIYHVHRSAYNNNASNDGHPQQMYPVCASSTNQIPGSTVSSYGNISSAGCPFPGTSYNRSFTDMSTPMAFSWTTNKGINKPIANITETAGKISFEFMPEMPDLQKVTINNTDVTLPETNESMIYMADCNEQSFQLNIQSNGTLTIRAGSTDYPNNSRIPITGDKTDITIIITTRSGDYPFPLIISGAIDKGLPLYVQRWGKTLSVINNPTINGGYNFDSYRWFHDADADAIVGSNGYIVCDNDCNRYYAEGLYNNFWHKLCKNIAIQTPPETLEIYPNPVPAGQPLYITSPEETTGVTIRIYDIHGRTIRRQTNTHNNIPAPEQPGLYFLQITSPDGTNTVQQIIVN
ncbi:MAG: M6 family metalloprotease domain-containing protein [Prevotellaceae bacterium]|jgi:M6 family metalloprotease-like protein|nr:M6 family metalloprotease domain-containing protein [Prevotellaceae bacterium]